MARFAVDTPADHRASLWIATLLSLCYATLTLLLRVWAKLATAGLDDAVMILAHIFSYAEQAVTMYNISNWDRVETATPGSAAASRLWQVSEPANATTLVQH
jgi:hypothetical protein